MNICTNHGHKYYPTVRRITDWVGIVREENIIYCSRCGCVKSLDTATPYWTWTAPGMTTTITTGSATSSSWGFIGHPNV